MVSPMKTGTLVSRRIPSTQWLTQSRHSVNTGELNEGPAPLSMPKPTPGHAQSSLHQRLLLSNFPAESPLSNISRNPGPIVTPPTFPRAWISFHILLQRARNSTSKPHRMFCIPDMMCGHRVTVTVSAKALPHHDKAHSLHNALLHSPTRQHQGSMSLQHGDPRKDLSRPPFIPDSLTACSQESPPH